MLDCNSFSGFGLIIRQVGGGVIEPQPGNPHIALDCVVYLIRPHHRSSTGSYLLGNALRPIGTYSTNIFRNLLTPRIPSDGIPLR